MRTYNGENAVLTETLNDDKVYHFLLLLLKIWQKELSIFLREQAASLERSKKLFFLSAVQLATGRTKEDGTWELENSEKAFSYGMSDVKDMFKEELPSIMPPGLDGYTSAAFIEDLVSFRKNTKEKLTHGNSKEKGYWMARYGFVVITRRSTRQGS